MCNKAHTFVFHVDAGKMFDTALGEQDYRTFSEWLQCYDQQGMKSVKDHNGRTIWYKVRKFSVLLCLNCSEDNDAEDQCIVFNNRE